MPNAPFVFPQGPAVKNEDRTLGLVCCPAGQLFAKARIDRSAYCPGEEVKITGHVSNQSSKQVTGTEVQLIQKVVFKAPHGKRETSLSVFYIPLACTLQVEHKASTVLRHSVQVKPIKRSLGHMLLWFPFLEIIDQQ